MSTAADADTSGFDPRNHLIKVKGQPYLETKWRLVWLRRDHPDAVIEIKFIELTDEAATFAATVTLPTGGSATGHSRETRAGFADYVEKSETQALGRALAALGYGVQFCGDFGDAGRYETKMERGQRSPMRTMGDEPESGDVPQRQSMTANQGEFIKRLADERGITGGDVAAKVKELFGKKYADMDRREASELIEWLREQEMGPVS